MQSKNFFFVSWHLCSSDSSMNVETGRISTNVTGQISVIVKDPRVSEPRVVEETASNSSETGPHE